MTKRYYFFCDESGLTKDRFLVISGIVICEACLERIHRGIQSFREVHRMWSELKWEKISDQKENEYRYLIDYFFHLNQRGLLDFHSLIVPYSRFDHKSINFNDRNLSLHKMYYQLILHRFCRYYASDGAALYIFPDLSSRPFCAGDARRILNRGVRSRYGITHNPVRTVEPRDSAECDFLQLNDVILGAVSAHRNGRHLSSTGRESKRRLAEYVLRRSGFPSYEINTPAAERRSFTIWNLESRWLRPLRQQPLTVTRRLD